MKKRIYLDDVRTPKDENYWVVVRNYEQFVETVSNTGLENIELISLDHDLGDTAMNEYFNNVSPNYKLDYNNILEKTGSGWSITILTIILLKKVGQKKNHRALFFP